MFLSVSDKHGVSIQSFIILGKTFFPKISHMKYCTDLILGEAFCIYIFFHLSDSRLPVFKGFHFNFDGVTGCENHQWLCCRLNSVSF